MSPRLQVSCLPRSVDSNELLRLTAEAWEADVGEYALLSKAGETHCFGCSRKFRSLHMQRSQLHVTLPDPYARGQ